MGAGSAPVPTHVVVRQTPEACSPLTDVGGGEDAQDVGDDRLPGIGRPNDNQRWVCPRRVCPEDGYGVVAPKCEEHKVLMVPDPHQSVT